MRPYFVAIVGAGPSGYYAAASLLKFADGSVAGGGPDIRVDMLEMLPTPWGLVRSGVAPDHPKIKSISKAFEKTSLDPRFRFFGNIAVGRHVQADELASRYDAVVYAVGAQSDRALNIPGEELPGSVAAVDFVGWYNAHPHFEEMAPDISSGRAVVVGVGNVALDVARILVTDPDVLANTDIADHALEMLQFTHAGKVDCIYIDPPYNTGARDWKYNNDYVDGNDSWRHSKWLTFMAKRLRIAKRLLNPADSVLIITIDEKEYLTLGMLLRQEFPDARIQMVSALINPAAVARTGYFGRSDEYYFFVMIGTAGAKPLSLSEEWVTSEGRTHKGQIR